MAPMALGAKWILLGSMPWVAACASRAATGDVDSGASLDDASSDVSPDEGAIDAGPQDDCGPLEWNAPACAACTAASCCALEWLCTEIETCEPLNLCANACGGDASCVTGCGSTYIDSISNYNAVLNCQMSYCRTECGR
jgi:hypothetical protein